MKAYLTIDDSPTPYTDLMIDWLLQNDMPAILFVRGDMCEKYGTDSLVRAIQKGFVIGNHAWSHRRASQMHVEDVINEIERTEGLISSLYDAAGVRQSGKIFRFPHLDRGTGGWVIDYDQLKPKNRDFIMPLFLDGVNLSADKPTDEQLAKKDVLQQYLAAQGYQQPFPDTRYEWFSETEMGAARDCMYTFSTSDWMLLPRHQGKWRYKTLTDLMEKADTDHYLWDTENAAIILAHDYEEGLFMSVAAPVLLHIKSKGMKFLPFS